MAKPFLKIVKPEQEPEQLNLDLSDDVSNVIDKTSEIVFNISDNPIDSFDKENSLITFKNPITKKQLDWLKSLFVQDTHYDKITTLTNDATTKSIADWENRIIKIKPKEKYDTIVADLSRSVFRSV